MIHHVLAAVDHSPRAAGVVRMAFEVAERFGARLRLLRAITIPQDFPPAAVTDPSHDHLAEVLVQRATRELEELAAPFPRALLEPPLVVIGEPWRAIVLTADELGVDLIVIGSHGWHGLDRLLGTTTGRIANRAHRSVLVVHEEAEATMRR